MGPLDRARFEITREGQLFLLVWLSLALLALRSGDNMLFLLLGFLLALLGASAVLSWLTLSGIEVFRHVPPRATAKTAFLVGIALKNNKKRLPSFSLEVEDLLVSLGIEKRCYFLKLPAQKRQQTNYRLTIERRGEFQFHGCYLSTRFPFSLYRIRRWVPITETLLIYPSQLPVYPKFRTQLLGPSHGMVSSQDTGEEFWGHRPFRTEDDPRLLDWKASARTGSLLRREYERPRGRQICIVFDSVCKTAEPSTSLENAISLVAGVVSHCLLRGDCVSFYTRSFAIAADRGAAQEERIMRALALLRFSPPDSPSVAISTTMASQCIWLYHPAQSEPPMQAVGQLVSLALPKYEAR